MKTTLGERPNTKSERRSFFLSRLPSEASWSFCSACAPSGAANTASHAAVKAKRRIRLLCSDGGPGSSRARAKRPSPARCPSLFDELFELREDGAPVFARVVGARLGVHVRLLHVELDPAGLLLELEANDLPELGSVLESAEARPVVVGERPHRLEGEHGAAIFVGLSFPLATKHERSANLPRGLERRAEEVLLHERGVRERAPDSFGRCL